MVSISLANAAATSACSSLCRKTCTNASVPALTSAGPKTLKSTRSFSSDDGTGGGVKMDLEHLREGGWECRKLFVKIPNGSSERCGSACQKPEVPSGSFQTVKLWRAILFWRAILLWHVTFLLRTWPDPR